MPFSNSVFDTICEGKDCCVTGPAIVVVAGMHQASVGAQRTGQAAESAVLDWGHELVSEGCTLRAGCRSWSTTLTSTRKSDRMQDFKFTVKEVALHMRQTRPRKHTALAKAHIAHDLPDASRCALMRTVKPGTGSPARPASLLWIPTTALSASACGLPAGYWRRNCYGGRGLHEGLPHARKERLA